jgi:hypothetical protein
MARHKLEREPAEAVQPKRGSSSLSLLDWTAAVFRISIFVIERKAENAASRAIGVMGS